mgnify:CR=1 FL=1
MERDEIRLSQILSPAFYQIHSDIQTGGHTHYFLAGGRGSGKSSFAATEIIFGMMKTENANAVALRRTAANLRDSVFQQLLWAMEILGVTQEWQWTVNPMEMTRKATGQKILFRGADDVRKMKSIRFGKGYCRYIWYEEADEFGGIEEIESINQSFMRGGDRFCVFYTYNPPEQPGQWMNQRAQEGRADSLFHRSSYLCMPREWLGEPFFLEAEEMKKRNERRYRNVYLGEVTGSGGEVFHNITLRNICDDEIRNYDRVARGLDWGYATDPTHYTINQLDKGGRRLIIFGEERHWGMGNRQIGEMIAKENSYNETVIADSAEPKSIAELCGMGLHVLPAKKGPDSVRFGMKWLQELEEIVIDPQRCPYTAKEFSNYSYEKGRDGGWKAYFPDRDNHAIDAVRYSREADMRKTRIR